MQVVVPGVEREHRAVVGDHLPHGCSLAIDVVGEDILHAHGDRRVLVELHRHQVSTAGIAVGVVGGEIFHGPLASAGREKIAVCLAGSVETLGRTLVEDIVFLVGTSGSHDERTEKQCCC